MTERRPVPPWALVAASAVLLVLALALFFGACLPAQRRVSGLETELRALYAREADLETRLEQARREAIRQDQQIASLTAERSVLTRRVDELERELGSRRSRR